MTYAIRVTEDYVGLMGRHVAEGQAIVPGAPLVDVMTPEGVVVTIVSEGWGIVAHVEGGRIFPRALADEDRAEGDDEDDDDEGESGSARGSSGGKGIVFSKGDVICHIVAREQHGTRKTGLHPRPAPSVRYRRMMGIGAG